MADASEDEKSMMAHGLYAIWLARNDTRDGKRIEEANMVARRVAARMEEWKNVRGRPQRSTSPTQRARWEPPASGWLKANVDGAMSRSRQGGGSGVVFRDEDGAF